MTYLPLRIAMDARIKGLHETNDAKKGRRVRAISQTKLYISSGFQLPASQGLSCCRTSKGWAARVFQGITNSPPNRYSSLTLSSKNSQNKQHSGCTSVHTSAAYADNKQATYCWEEVGAAGRTAALPFGNRRGRNSWPASGMFGRAA